MSPRPSPRRDQFWNDQPSWDDARDAQRTRSHRRITRGNRIIPALRPTDPTPTSQSRMFDYENDDPDYSTGTVRPTSTPTPSGGYAWEVTSADDLGGDDDGGETPDQSGEFGLGTYSGLAAGGQAARIDSKYDQAEVGLADRPRRVLVDPLLMRLGIIIAIAVLATPFAIG
ncbi:MAG: hypothetical protein M3337_05710, partial [Actinomycetota bacterium]|nr:hypothetical protein [Actinomycetota bacterium]